MQPDHLSHYNQKVSLWMAVLANFFYKNNESVSENSSLFIPSICKDGIVFLPIGQIFLLQQQNCLLKISLNYRDSYNQISQDFLELDFSEINKENRLIRGQYTPKPL
jgi:hypothetical protein